MRDTRTFMNRANADGPPCRVGVETLEDLAAIWHNASSGLEWACPFVLPPWLNAWWRVFGHDVEPLLTVARQGEAVIGIAPLMIQDERVRFLGSPDVCDHFDCAVVPGKERLFFTSLVAYLRAQGFRDLDLGPIRPDATALKFFSQSRLPDGSECRVREEDVSLALDLPATWDEFLSALDGKQRHELRRKLRRLHEAGRVRLRAVGGAARLPEAVEAFLGLFTMNREDKAAFMTGRMVAFFRELSLELAREGLLRLFFLDLDGQPVASVYCFDHRGTRYLYNNGYDDAYRGISVGLMSKVLSIKAAIDEGLRRYDLLKGGEAYKYRLSGKETQLLRCMVTLH